MKELLNELIDTLITYRCQSDVFISKNIPIPDGFNQRGFNFIQKENIRGVVCFGGGCPFSSKDFDIQDILNAHYEINKHMSKAHSVILEDSFGSGKYFKFNPLENNGIPEMIR